MARVLAFMVYRSQTDCDPPIMKKNKALVTVFALAFHLVLIFWAFQQMQ